MRVHSRNLTSGTKTQQHALQTYSLRCIMFLSSVECVNNEGDCYTKTFSPFSPMASIVMDFCKRELETLLRVCLLKARAVREMLYSSELCRGWGNEVTME